MNTDKVIPIRDVGLGEWRAGEDKNQICGFREIRGFPALSLKDLNHDEHG